jgi:CDGSH-type Zn-finger protein
MSAPALRGPTRTYANDAIEVHWEPRLCIHVQNCVHKLPQVFKAEERPWIVVDGAVVREDTRVALCRRGASGNKPFCDGSHRRIGFTTD